MSVVSASHFKLVKARKLLEKSYRNKDWDALRHWDAQLAECMTAVFDDENRDTRALVNELESILHTYTRMIIDLPDEALRTSVDPLP